MMLAQRVTAYNIEASSQVAPTERHSDRKEMTVNRKQIGARRVSLVLLALMSGASAFAQPPGDPGKPPKPDKKRTEGRDFRDLTPEMRARLDQLPPKERQAIEILRRMVTTGLGKAFLAREVTIKSGGQESEQWVKWDPQRGLRRESIRPVGNIFIDDLKRSYAYVPKDRKWYVSDSMMPRPQGRIGDVLRRLYKGEVKATLDGQDTVAGRAADIVRVAPPEGGRGPVMRIWIDRATGMRLKTEMLSPDGRLFNSTYYLSLDLSPKFRSDDFTPPANAEPMPGRPVRRRSYRSLADANKERVRPRVPSYLPTGFILRVIDVEDLPGGGMRMSTRYGNGVTVVSLVEMPSRTIPSKMLDRLGPNHAGFLADPRGGPDRAYAWRDGDTVFMLFGTLPDDELKRVADSVR